jgi:hypothetical protein
MILKAIQVVPKMKEDMKMMDTLRCTCVDLSFTISQNEGMLSDVTEKEGTKNYTPQFKHHFCHGSPGAIPFLLAAAKVFERDERQFLDSAAKAGYMTWRYGVLLKGNGLCHGIAGNAYMMHMLYREWDARAKGSNPADRPVNEHIA